MSVRGLLSILWQQIGIILVVAALFAAGGAWANSGQAAVWAATAYVLMPDAPFVTGPTPANRDRQIQTDIASVQELAFTEEMLTDAGLDMDPDAARAAITITPLEGTDIVRVVVTGSSEEQVEALAEVAAPLFAESLNDFKSAPYYELAESLRERAADDLAELQESTGDEGTTAQQEQARLVYLNMAYESALEALGEAERASSANQVLSYSVSAVPGPSPVRGGLLGLLAGLLVGCAVAYWWYAAGDSPADGSRRPGLDAPVLGLVHLDCRSKASGGAAPGRGSDDPAAALVARQLQSAMTSASDSSLVLASVTDPSCADRASVMLAGAMALQEVSVGVVLGGHASGADAVAGIAAGGDSVTAEIVEMSGSDVDAVSAIKDSAASLANRSDVVLVAAPWEARTDEAALLATSIGDVVLLAPHKATRARVNGCITAFAESGIQVAGVVLYRPVQRNASRP